MIAGSDCVMYRSDAFAETKVGCGKRLIVLLSSVEFASLIVGCRVMRYSPARIVRRISLSPTERSAVRLVGFWREKHGC